MPQQPALAVNDVYEVVQSGHQMNTGALIIQRYYVQIQTAVIGDFISDLAAAEQLQWQTAMLALLTLQYKHEYTKVSRLLNAQFLGAPTKPFWEFDAGWFLVTNQAGTYAGVDAPAMLTASILYRTGYTGRYWHGGLRLGPLGDAATLSSELTAAAQALIFPTVNTFVLSTRTAVTGSTWKQVLASAAYAVAFNLQAFPAQCTATIISTALTPHLRTCRSRLAPHVP